ncbi:MAG: phosphomannomutase/phosphoglucomutase [Candidatus Berkelbacteria bacterium]|nr:phosphomannomutase/phosphoglucomutase [Candidatus Berkelbacteria bacterium]
MIDEKIFKSYDVRGIYPTQINGEAAFKIGQAFADYIGSDIVVGRDMRTSSDEIFENFAKGVNSLGFNVVELGLCTTPMLNFAVASRNFKGGAMITASHNPAEYNGIKLIGEKAVQLSKNKGITEIKELTLNKKFETSNKPGAIQELDILGDYVNWLASKIGEVKKFKIVVDCGNGVAGISAKPVFEKLGLDVEELYYEPDGTFPNHAANPAEDENLKDAEEKVKQTKADLGIVFDGDGDRAFFIDEFGKTHNVGFLLAAIAEHELKNKPGEKIYYDLRFSKGVVDTIKKAGGIPIRTKVGNPFYKEHLILEGGLMAAEYSGHFMYKEHYGLDDGLFSALKVMYWLTKTGKTYSEFLAPYEKNRFVTGEINVKTEESGKIINKLKEKYKDGKFDELDGITVEYPDWWFNLRSSNTEPVVRLNIEADNFELLSEKKEELLDIING